MSFELTYIAAINLMHFRCHEICRLVRSILRLQYKICVLQAVKAYKSGHFLVKIQLSPPSSWSQRSTGYTMVEVDSVPWLLTLHIVWALVPGNMVSTMFNIQSLIGPNTRILCESQGYLHRFTSKEPLTSSCDEQQ